MRASFVLAGALAGLAMANPDFSPSADGNPSPGHSFLNPAFVSVHVPVDSNIEGNTVNAPGALSPFSGDSAKAQKRASVDGNGSPQDSFLNPAFVSVDVPVDSKIEGNTVNAPDALSPYFGSPAKAQRRANPDFNPSADGNLSPDHSFLNPAFVSVDVPVDSNIEGNTVDLPGASSPSCGYSAQAPTAASSGKVAKRFQA